MAQPSLEKQSDSTMAPSTTVYHRPDREADINDSGPGSDDEADADVDVEKHIATAPAATLSRWQRFLQAISDPVPAADPGPPPDGGVQAWCQVAACCCVIAATWGYVTSYGVFQTYFEQTLTQSASAISWVGSLQIFLLFALSTVSGRALDAGFLRAVFVVGMALQMVGIFTTSVATQYYQLFLAQGVCMGVGNALQFCPSVGVVSTYFVKKKTFAISIGAMGSALGSMLFAGIVKGLLPTIGFPWTVRVLGFVILALDLVSLALLRNRLPPRRSGPLIEWAAFKEAPYVLYCAGMFCVFWGIYFGFFYVGTFSRAVIGFDYSHSINLLIVMNGVGVIGRLVPGYIADRWLGPLNAIIPVAVLLAVMMYVWAAVDSEGGLYAFAAFYGLAAAGIQALWPGTLSSLTTDLSKAGTRMGMGFTLVSLACLTGTPIGGALISADGGRYLGAQIFAGTSIIIGVCLLICSRLAKTGFVLKCKA